MNLKTIEFKQEEYTGENRCEPCTLLNLIIAGILGTAIARRSRIGGVIAVGFSITLIYFRGYLIPGTPTLTKRYLPQEVLQWFGKEASIKTASGFGPTDEFTERATESSDEDNIKNTESKQGEDVGLDLESYFLKYGVLKLCKDQTDLCLTPKFKDQWNRAVTLFEIEDICTEDIIKTYGLNSEDEYDIEVINNSRVLYRDGRFVGQWPSKAALIADMAAAEILIELDPTWAERNSEQKGEILNALRLFLDTCPSGESVELTEEVVESCCSSEKVIAAVCEESGERLFEQSVN
jgi:hypothetical protein